ncbi:hypothetical protein CCAX7_43690 [Capsulimonas corticalis]|uniref:Uncharacterized protein n=1 Tax=Capsulimonas corticalis TaxID=2219043 RepID=A0A402CXE1_9BACT|nr:hypothetical protein [Capsulimonas corticalis]BDI32318.1 hypothetical protein CCAX7_43690 [Capsulimonas corticalis]
MAVETVYALFQTVSDAERAIGALIDHGLSHNDVGVITRRAAEQNETAHVREDFTRVTDPAAVANGEPEAVYVARPGALPAASLADTVTPASSVDTAENVDAVGKMGITTTTVEDAKAGAAVGTGIGMVAGLLAAAAAITIPGFGIVLAGGALAAALGATVATTAAGAVAGGVAGYLRDMGMAEHAATRYADRVAEGDYLIAARIDPSDYDNIKRLLEKYNAVGIDINVNAAGEDVRQSWGNDASLQQYIADTSPAAVPLPARAMEDPNIMAEPVPMTPVVPIAPPAPASRFITETEAGVPVVPAQVLTETSAEDEANAHWLAETPEEAALRRGQEEDELVTRRPLA